MLLMDCHKSFFGVTHSSSKIIFIETHALGEIMNTKQSIFEILLDAYNEYRKAYIASKYSRLESY